MLYLAFTAFIMLNLNYAAKKAKAVGRHPLKRGGEAVSVYETIVIIILSMSFIITLIKLMIYIADKFSKRK